MKGITYTQVAQYCVLIFAYTVPAVFIAIQITGNAIPQFAFGSEIAGAGVGLLDKLDDIVTSLGFNQYTSGTKSRIDVLCITLALMVGTAGLPHVIVRFFTVPKVRDARISAGYALLFIAILYTTAPAVGAMARYNLINTMQPGTIGAADGNLVYEDRPAWFHTWQQTGLVQFEDKNGDGRIQYYNDANADFADTANSYGWQGNELVVDRDIMVLANPEIAGLPSWVIALVAAGGIAAALSTAAGLLLVISAAVSHDLIKGNIPARYLGEKGIDGGPNRRGVRNHGGGLPGLRSTGLGCPSRRVRLWPCRRIPVSGDPARHLLQAGKQARCHRRHADRAVFHLRLYRVFQRPVSQVGRGAPWGENMADQWLFGISPEGIGVVGMMLNFVVAITVSHMTSPPPEHIQHLVENIRVPQNGH